VDGSRESISIPNNSRSFCSFYLQGKGIMHAEMPVHAEGQPEPRGLQLWVNLPKKFKMVEPSYQELGPSEIPTAYPKGPEGPVRVKVISGSSHGVDSPVRTLGGCWYFHYTFTKDKVTVFQDLRKLIAITPHPHLTPMLLASGWTAFIYILKGTLIVGQDSIPQEQFHTLVLSANLNETGVLLKSGSEDTEFMLVCVVHFGPGHFLTCKKIARRPLSPSTNPSYRYGMPATYPDWCL
jgi:redox-sensitive bicupin YhaK (pirin superfamily)